eukprot:766024-Hanusia_phi.AAC.1
MDLNQHVHHDLRTCVNRVIGSRSAARPCPAASVGLLSHTPSPEYFIIKSGAGNSGTTGVVQTGRITQRGPAKERPGCRAVPQC